MLVGVIGSPVAMPRLSAAREQLLQRFRATAIERLRRLGLSLLEHEMGSPAQPLPESVRRDLHTLKGESRMLGLISAAALLMCLGAPLLAGVVAAWDRRQLLTGCMLWYGLMHLVCAAMPSFETLLAARVLTVLSPAVFTTSGTLLCIL